MPVEGEETKSRKVFSSPLWLSVRFCFHRRSIRLCSFTDEIAQIGASGTGRTTFVNTLCESEVLAHKISDSPDTAHVEEGIRIKPFNVGELLTVKFG